MAKRLVPVLLSSAALAGCAGRRDMPQRPVPPLASTPTLRVASAAMDAGLPEVALNVALNVLQREPRNYDAMRLQAAALYDLRDYATAEQAYRDLVRLWPNSAEARLGLGRCLLVRRDLPGAESEFRTAARIAPGPEALSDLGIVLDLLGRHDEAQAAFQQAVDRDPTSIPSRVNYALSLAGAGQGGRAREVLAPAEGAAAGTPWASDVAAAQRTIDGASNPPAGAVVGR